MLKDYLRKAVDGEDLSQSDAIEAMRIIMSGQATPAQIAGFLIAMRLKGETVEEIAGFARVMREMAVAIDVEDTVDTCGTGGDRSSTFNISTTAALVAAGMGIRVAKHGNRAVSSSSGSADVLKELGVNLDAEPDVVAKCIKQAGIGFLFAPKLHLAMKHAIGPRREMGVRTVFNILGPLTNPAGAKRQVIGVYDGVYTQIIADVLRLLGAVRAMVVHGEDGLDEVSVSSSTMVSELRADAVRSYRVTPEEMGFTRSPLSALCISNPTEAAAAVRAVLAGETGPRRDIVLANSAAVAVVAERAETLAEGVKLAAQSIDSGRAREALVRLVAISNGG